MMDPTYPLVPLANFVAAFLTLLTLLTTQLRESWNMGVCMLSSWVFVTTLSTGIQTVVWRDSADTTIAPVFCDITTRIQIGTLAAMPACALIITRSLYRIVRYQTVTLTDARQRRNELLLNLFLVLGLPLILNVLYYVVQTSRFQVIEQVGCSFAVDSSWLALLLLNSAPVLLSFISVAIYMSRTVFFFWKHKRNMNNLFGRQITISRSVYLRVFMIGFINVLIACTGAIANFFPLPIRQFYPGWSGVHADWKPVSIYASEWHADGPFVLFQIVWEVWINVWLAVAIFGLFGFTDEARKAYMRACYIVLNWATRLCLGKRRKALPTLPVHTHGPSKLCELKHMPSFGSNLAGLSAGQERSMNADTVTIEITIAVEEHSDQQEEHLAEGELEEMDDSKTQGIAV